MREHSSQQFPVFFLSSCQIQVFVLLQSMVKQQHILYKLNLHWHLCSPKFIVYSPPAGWGSLDFTYKMQLLLPSSFLHSLSSLLSSFCTVEWAPGTISPAPDSAGHAWTQTPYQYRQLDPNTISVLLGTPGPERQKECQTECQNSFFPEMAIQLYPIIYNYIYIYLYLVNGRELSVGTAVVWSGFECRKLYETLSNECPLHPAKWDRTVYVFCPAANTEITAPRVEGRPRPKLWSTLCYHVHRSKWL